MKKTFNDLMRLDGVVARLLKDNSSLFDTKFGIAYKKHLDKNLSVIMSKRNDGLNDIYLENALTDPTTGAVLFDKDSELGYKVSKEGFKQIKEDVKEFAAKFDNSEYEVEPIACKELPEGFDVSPIKEIVEGLFV